MGENQNIIQDMIEKHSEKVNEIVVAIDELGINQLETKDIANDHSETLNDVELRIKAAEKFQIGAEIIHELHTTQMNRYGNTGCGVFKWGK